MIRIHYRHSTKQRTDTGAFKPGRRDHPNNELQAREFLEGWFAEGTGEIAGLLERLRSELRRVEEAISLTEKLAASSRVPKVVTHRR